MYKFITLITFLLLFSLNIFAQIEQADNYVFLDDGKMEDHTTKSYFGDDFKFYRLSKGKTLRQLSKLIPFSIEEIVAIEENKIVPTLWEMNEITKALEVDYYICSITGLRLKDKVITQKQEYLNSADPRELESIIDSIIIDGKIILNVTIKVRDFNSLGSEQ